MQIQKSFKNNTNSFYIIPTPIGNLEDITLRTLKILQELDILYCEDKRVTQKLLNYYEIKVTLHTYNEFSFSKESQNILSHLENNKKIGLVSDAGMPGISDPGYKIIKLIKQHNYNVVILPGAVAYILPQVYATVNEQPFMFKGFLSKNKTQYHKEIEEIIQAKFNTIIYESPHRINKTISIINIAKPKTKILLARELTKIYEEYLQGTAQEINEYLVENKIKGEIVLIISPIEEKIEVDYVQEVQNLITAGFSKKDAIKEIAQKYNISKNKLYDKVLKEL
ncbi:MAG: 16S rRNA (cytidine(1402)-2'-O)-methyltransferase [Mycoplasmatales bacterium]